MKSVKFDYLEVKFFKLQQAYDFMLLCCRFQFLGSSLGTPRAMTLFGGQNDDENYAFIFFTRASYGSPETRKPDEIVETASD